MGETSGPAGPGGHSQGGRTGCQDGWLRSDHGLLELAEDRGVPLLDRVRYLATFASSLDEFFMARVARLTPPLAAGRPAGTVPARADRHELARIHQLAGTLMDRHAACYHESVLPALTAHGIHLLRWPELADAERRTAHRLFREHVYPLLTPLVVDSAHPFPSIAGLSLNLAVAVTEPWARGQMFVQVKVASQPPRFIEVSRHRFVPLEDVIVTGPPAGWRRSGHLHPYRVKRPAPPTGILAVGTVLAR